MSRELIKEAMLKHNVDNELLAETLINSTTVLFIEAVAQHLRSNGYESASAFLTEDTRLTLARINAQKPEYLGDES